MASLQLPNCSNPGQEMKAATSIGHVMNHNFAAIAMHAGISAALKLLQGSNLSIIPVIDNERLVGIVRYEDLNSADNGKTVEHVMQMPLYIEKGTSIDNAIKYILKHKIGMVPVVESSIGMRCIGTVSSSELLKAKKQQ